MKDVLWIPSRCQNLHQEIVYLNVYVFDFRRWAREHPSFRTMRQHSIASQPGRIICEKCGRPAWPIEAHHVIPLWALAVESLCSILIVDDSHLRWGVWKEPRPYEVCPPSYELWNSRENILLLCPDCHKTHEKNEFVKQRTVLTEKYAPFLCFGREQAKKRFSEHWQRSAS